MQNIIKYIKNVVSGIFHFNFYSRFTFNETPKSTNGPSLQRLWSLQKGCCYISVKQFILVDELWSLHWWHQTWLMTGWVSLILTWQNPPVCKLQKSNFLNANDSDNHTLATIHVKSLVILYIVWITIGEVYCLMIIFIFIDFFNSFLSFLMLMSH